MMKYSYVHLFNFLAVCLLSLSSAWAQTQTRPAYYSTTGQSSFERACSLGITCGRISNETNAVDNDFTTFATLHPSTLTLGLFPIALRMHMSGLVPKNYRAGVVIGANTGLSAIGTVTLRTYRTGDAAPKQSLNITTLALAVLGSTTPGRVEFLATEPFDQVEIEINSLLNVGYDVKVYYAYGVDANVVETAGGVLSRFAAPADGAQYSTAVVDNNVTICVNSNVLNPERAADQSLTNYALFTTFLGVSCPNTLRVKLEAEAPAGYQAGFVVEQQGLVDVTALAGLRITTYRNGVVQEVVGGAQLLSVALLPDGKQHISFPSTLAFDELQLTRSSALSVLDDLRIFFGFGLEPSVFRDQTPVLSNFASGANQFDVSSNGVLCVLCANVLNPERAADSNLNDYAILRTGLAGAVTSSALRLNLNGTGLAGNTAGVALNQGAGLLNTQLLSGITLRTYGGANGNQLLETTSGASLLQQGLLPDGRIEVFFRTTQNFQRVEIEVDNAVTLLDQTRVYYAFAHDRPQGIPTITNPAAAPLPVVLRAFQARAVEEGVEVSWQTASELSNSHFVIERAQQPTDRFMALSQVKGAGTTASSHTYSFHDETAKTLGAPALYYRLRQVDVDGNETFSPVAVVVLGKQVPPHLLEAYPNPAATSGEVRVRLHTPEAGLANTLAVYDLRGILLRQLPVSEATVTLTGTALPSGLYHLVLTNMQGQQLGTQRLMITGW